MGKNPAFQFYPNDWTRDLEEHPLEIEGAWIRICCKLWWAEPKGQLGKTLIQWARILRTSEEEAETLMKYIQNEKIGNVTFPLHVTDGNGLVTVESRRMMKDNKDRELTKLRVRKYRDKKGSNAPVTQKKQRSSSSSSSSSTSGTKEKESIYKENAQKILDHLNQKKGSKYRDTSNIIARLKEGKTSDECIQVIENKLKDQFFRKEPNHLNPITLFRKSHFDKYLNDIPHPLQDKFSQQTIQNIETMEEWINEK